MYNIKVPHKNKSLFLFHINTCFFNKNFDELQHLLSCTLKKFFDIIAKVSQKNLKASIFIK